MEMGGNRLRVKKSIDKPGFLLYIFSFTAYISYICIMINISFNLDRHVSLPAAVLLPLAFCLFIVYYVLYFVYIRFLIPCPAHINICMYKYNGDEVYTI